MRRRRPILGLLILTLIVCGVAYGAWGRWLARTMATAVDPEDTTRITFEVQPGDSAGMIAARLEVRELIASGFAFSWTVSDRGLDTAFQQGAYQLSRSMTPDTILTILTSKNALVRVTLPEGFTTEDMGQKLADAGIADPFEFKKCVQTCRFPEEVIAALPEGMGLEGYLFPDTYEFRTGTAARDVVQLLVDTFDRRLSEDLRAEIRASGRTVHEVVTVASMIEKEVRTPKDRRMVSGILWKRLEEGIPLGVDATVLYALGRHTTELTRDELQIDSPYNTRIKKGLPPGPICNPGLDAIEAAIRPTESEYLFYLTDAEGVAHYARTNAEHEANKARYLQ